RAEPRSILEVGTGIGSMSSRLNEVVSYRGVEQDPASFEVASRRLGQNVRLGGVEVLDDTQVDMVCAFEVLEHIEHDDDALREWAAFLPSGGWLLLSVPADPDLFGPDDIAAGHFRRYTRESLTRVLEQARYDVVSMEATGAGFGQLLQW